MKKYQVGVKIYNSFEVEAESEEDAEMKVRELDVYATLMDCDFNITHVDEVKGRNIPREMCEDLLAKARGEHHAKYSIYQSDCTLDESKICDDGHGNTLGGYPTGSVDFGSSME
jgi:hypothetical protein